MGKRPSAQQTTRLRAEIIMEDRCGLITAAQVAECLGLSRNTYYEWERLGLNALRDGVIDQNSGRRAHPSHDLRQSLEKQLLEANRQVE